MGDLCLARQRGEQRGLQARAELRCLVCQNQTIADSHAELAQDLRQQVRDMLQTGQSDAQIIDILLLSCFGGLSTGQEARAAAATKRVRKA